MIAITTSSSTNVNPEEAMSLRGLIETEERETSARVELGSITTPLALRRPRRNKKSHAPAK
jgi:hypothetical protein